MFGKSSKPVKERSMGDVLAYLTKATGSEMKAKRLLVELKRNEQNRRDVLVGAEFAGKDARMVNREYDDRMKNICKKYLAPHSEEFLDDLKKAGLWAIFLSALDPTLGAIAGFVGGGKALMKETHGKPIYLPKQRNAERASEIFRNEIEKRRRPAA